MLIIYANKLDNNFNIVANGSSGGQVEPRTETVSGGASGGGSINIFYSDKITGIENIVATGGISNSGDLKGGEGGTGCVTIGSIETGSFVCEYKNYE